MDIQQVTYNPSTMCGVKTQNYTIQGKNAEEVVQIYKGLQPSGAAQVVNGLIGLASTAAICWFGYQAMKAINQIGKKMPNENEEEGK